MHIVNKRKDLTLGEALQTPDGLAVLGFFIEVTIIRHQKLCRKSFSMAQFKTRTIAPSKEVFLGNIGRKILNYRNAIRVFLQTKLRAKEITFLSV